MSSTPSPCTLNGYAQSIHQHISTLHSNRITQGGHITQPDEIAGLPPPVLQVTFAHTPPLNTTCRGHGDRFRPFVFSLVIAKSAWSTATALRIDGWPRFLQLYQPDWMVSGEQQIPPTPTFLLGHFRLSDYYTEEQKTLLMHMHMRWHSALGFQGAVVYEPRPSIYTGHADTAHLIAHNMLTVMRWLYEDHGYAMLRVNAGDYYDQGLVYNHMMLAYYGRNTYLLLTNPDEVRCCSLGMWKHTSLFCFCGWTPAGGWVLTAAGVVSLPTPYGCMATHPQTYVCTTVPGNPITNHGAHYAGQRVPAAVEGWCGSVAVL